MSGLEVAAAGAIIGGGLSAGGSIMRGKEEQRASLFEADQLRGRAGQQDIQAKQHDVQEQVQYIAGAEAEAKRRDDLTTSLEALSAIRAGRGVSMTSPTGTAIASDVIAGGERDIHIEQLSYLQKAEEARNEAQRARFNASQSRQAAGMAERKGKMSMISGFLDAGSKVASSGLSYAKTQNYAKER